MVEPFTCKQQHRNVKHCGLRLGHGTWDRVVQRDGREMGAKPLKDGSVPLSALSHRPQVNTSRNILFVCPWHAQIKSTKRRLWDDSVFLQEMSQTLKWHLWCLFL